MSDATQPPADLVAQLAALRAKVAILETILTESPDPAFSLRPDGSYSYANRAFAEGVGKPVGEVIGHTMWDVFSRDEADSRFAILTDVVRIGAERVIEVCVPRAGGDRYYLTTLSPIRDAQGVVSSVVCSSKEITDRKRAEDAREKGRERLRSLIEHSPISMAIVDLDGTIEYINRRAIETFGFLPEDIPNMERWWALAYPDEAYRAEVIAQWMGLLEQAMASGREIERREYRVTRMDGSVIPTVIFGVLVAGKVFVMFEDIAAQKQAEEERLELERRLLHSQKLESLGILAGGVAHDFNNLLTAILGNLELALFDVPEGSEARSSIACAMAAGRRAAGLATGMLAYSGRGAFVVEALDLNFLIEENAAIFMASAAKTATLTLRLHPGLPRTLADAAQIQQIVMNLITNASEALGDSTGNIVLSTGVQACDARYLARSCLDAKPPPGRFVWLEVADNGCGMAAETVKKLFDPFFTTKFTGRGLGMSAVLGIVRGHRGAILVDSLPGAGTTIRVLFPVGGVDVGSLPTFEAPALVPVEAPGGLVLVVDDEDLVRSTCCSMVETLGFRVVSAGDGLEALRVFKEHSSEVRVVLLDLTMPKLDGLATFRELHRLRPDLPVILCSGFSEQEIAARCAGEGIAGFMQKPYGLKLLKQQISGVLKVPGAG